VLTGRAASRVHPAADRTCRPLAFVLTAGQAADSPQFIPVPGKIRVRGPAGRPRTGPDAAAGDKAYSSRGNPVDHDAGFYAGFCKAGNTVERLINKLKARRGIATRYGKTPESCLAGLHPRAPVIWIKDLTRTRAGSRAGHRGT
jgi:transposase